jgi:hypothetical protein
VNGHEAVLDKCAAQKVSLKGTVKGQSMTVESVTPGKLGSIESGRSNKFGGYRESKMIMAACYSLR